MRGVNRNAQLKKNILVRIYLDGEKLRRSDKYHCESGNHFFDNFRVCIAEGRFYVTGHNGECPDVFDEFIVGYSIQEYGDTSTPQHLLGRNGIYRGDKFGDATAETTGQAQTMITAEGSNLQQVFDLYDALDNPKQQWRVRISA